MGGLRAARAAGYLVRRVPGGTLRVRALVLDVGWRVPDEVVGAFVAMLTRRQAGLAG